MKFLKKHFQLILLGSAFLVTRVVNLGVIPIFTDEAIYSYWAQVALFDPANRYISLEDGKQPLFIWLAAIAQKFISDPLMATRSVSIAAGAFSLYGIFLLSKLLFSSKVARVACLLYIVLPFTLLYDRMGLYDSLLTATIIYSVYFSIKLASRPGLLYSLLTGLFLGLGLLTKSSALLYLFLLPLPFIILNYPKNLIKNGVKWALFAGVAAVIAQLIYNTLRLSPLFYMINRKNLTFIKPFSDFINDPFMSVLSNMRSMLEWQISYLGPPLLLLLTAYLIYALFTKNHKIALLFGYILFPFAVEAFFNTVLYPRFMLFYFPFVIIILAFYLDQLRTVIKKVPIYYIIFIAFLAYPVINSYLLLTDPPKSMIATSDKNQYIQEWPAGYGVNEVVDVLKKETESSNIYVATEGTFGLLPYALKIYFFNQVNPQIVGYWPLNSDSIPAQILEESKRLKTYIVFNESQKEITNSNLKLVGKYQKGSGNSYMRLYEVHE